MAVYEDSSPTLLPVEQYLVDGVSYAATNKLLAALRQNVTSGADTTIAARAIVREAHRFEPGALFVGYFSEEDLDVSFATKRRTLDIDSALKPSYGYVKKALQELEAAGIDSVIVNMWLDYFRKDNGLYRVAVVAGICLTAAFLDAGFRVTV